MSHAGCWIAKFQPELDLGRVGLTFLPDLTDVLTSLYRMADILIWSIFDGVARLALADWVANSLDSICHVSGNSGTQLETPEGWAAS